jgi:hypothetical protein
VGGSRDSGRASDGGWIEMQSTGGRAPESARGELQEFVDLDLSDIRKISAASLEGRDEEEGWKGSMADMPSAPPVQDEEHVLALPEVSELAEETVSSSAAVKRRSLAEFEPRAEGLPGRDLPPVPSPRRQHWKKVSSLVQEDGGSQLLKTARFGPVSANIQQRASNK